MDIKDIRKRIKNAELDIYNILIMLEKETGISVININLETSDYLSLQYHIVKIEIEVKI